MNPRTQDFKTQAVTLLDISYHVREDLAAGPDVTPYFSTLNPGRSRIFPSDWLTISAIASVPEVTVVTPEVVAAVEASAPAAPVVAVESAAASVAPAAPVIAEVARVAALVAGVSLPAAAAAVAASVPPLPVLPRVPADTEPVIYSEFAPGSICSAQPSLRKPIPILTNPNLSPRLSTSKSIHFFSSLLICVFSALSKSNSHQGVARQGRVYFFDARQFRVLTHDFNPMLLEAAIDFAQEKHLTRYFLMCRNHASILPHMNSTSKGHQRPELTLGQCGHRFTRTSRPAAAAAPAPSPVPVAGVPLPGVPVAQVAAALAPLPVDLDAPAADPPLPAPLPTLPSADQQVSSVMCSGTQYNNISGEKYKNTINCAQVEGDATTLHWSSAASVLSPAESVTVGLSTSLAWFTQKRSPSFSLNLFEICRTSTHFFAQNFASKKGVSCSIATKSDFTAGVSQ